MMSNFLKFLFLWYLFLLTTSANASSRNWDDVIDAISMVESKGDERKVNSNGSCVGLLQITVITVKECNSILKSKKSKKRFSNLDRYSASKSKEMFALIQEKYNKNCDIETAIRLWNGGIGGLKNKSKTNGYLKKVMKYYKGGK